MLKIKHTPRTSMLAQRVLDLRFSEPRQTQWPDFDLKEQQELNRLAQQHEVYTPGIRRSTPLDIQA